MPKPCVACGTATGTVVNINFQLTYVCDGCCLSIARQTVKSLNIRCLKTQAIVDTAGKTKPVPDSWPTAESLGFTIIEAGVDPTHQTVKCDYCGKSLLPEEGVKTCDVHSFLTLCPDCYSKAGNNVR